MQFMMDGIPITTKVRWYRCGPDAKALGIPTCFGSSVWDTTRDAMTVAVGEVRGASKLYYRGDPPGILSGTHHEGSDYSFRNGLSVADLNAPTSPVTTDCQYVFTDCIWCPNGAPPQYQLDINGIAGSAACLAINGTYLLSYVNGCRWESPTFTLPAPLTGTWRFRFSQSEFFQFVNLIRINASNGAAWQADRVPGCYSTLELPFIFSSFVPCTFTGSTATVTSI